MSTVATPPAVSAASDLTPVGRRLAGKTAVITGGTTGLGFATAQRFLAEGARVLVTGQDAGRVAEAAAALGPGAVALRADVRAVADLDAFAARAREVFGAPGDGPTSDANGGADAGAEHRTGGVDVVFANAGVGGFAPLEHADEAHFDQQFAVNVKGVYFTVQRLLPLLRPGASVILNASAVSAKGLPAASVYFATKAAVRSLARTLAARRAGQRRQPGARADAVRRQAGAARRSARRLRRADHEHRAARPRRHARGDRRGRRVPGERREPLRDRARPARRRRLGQRLTGARRSDADRQRPRTGWPRAA